MSTWVPVCLNSTRGIPMLGTCGDLIYNTVHGVFKKKIVLQHFRATGRSTHSLERTVMENCLDRSKNNYSFIFIQNIIYWFTVPAFFPLHGPPRPLMPTRRRKSRMDKERLVLLKDRHFQKSYKICVELSWGNMTRKSHKKSIEKHMT